MVIDESSPGRPEMVSAHLEVGKGRVVEQTADFSHGTVQLTAPRNGALTLAQRLPVRQVAQLLGVTDHRLWLSLNRLVGEARTKQSHAAVRRVGVDEKHVARLGNVSLFHDALAMDLSGAFQAGAAKHLPNAALCFDAFHLIKLANEALDKVRREEVNSEAELRGIRWATLKDAHDWTMNQLTDMHWLQRSGLKTARAWCLKERLREILHEARAGADPEQALQRWVSWARRSRLEPFTRLAATIRDHLQGILNSYRFRLRNATAESINATVQAAILRARAFRTLANLLTIIYLVAGKLTNLPKPPYRTPGSVPV